MSGKAPLTKVGSWPWIHFFQEFSCAIVDLCWWAVIATGREKRRGGSSGSTRAVESVLTLPGLSVSLHGFILCIAGGEHPPCANATSKCSAWCKISASQGSREQHPELPAKWAGIWDCRRTKAHGPFEDVWGNVKSNQPHRMIQKTLPVQRKRTWQSYMGFTYRCFPRKVVNTNPKLQMGIWSMEEKHHIPNVTQEVRGMAGTASLVAVLPCTLSRRQKWPSALGSKYLTNTDASL